MTTATDADTDVDMREFVQADCEERFVDLRAVRLLVVATGLGVSDWVLLEGIYLEAKDFGLDEGERLAVHFDDALASLINIC